MLCDYFLELKAHDAQYKLLYSHIHIRFTNTAVCKRVDGKLPIKSHDDILNESRKIDTKRIPSLPFEVADYMLDKHTMEGRRMGRGFEHFFKEGAVLANTIQELQAIDDWTDEVAAEYISKERSHVKHVDRHQLDIAFKRKLGFELGALVKFDRKRKHNSTENE